jgi:hypothetical protein
MTKFTIEYFAFEDNLETASIDIWADTVDEAREMLEINLRLGTGYRYQSKTDWLDYWISF